MIRKKVKKTINQVKIEKGLKGAKEENKNIFENL